MDVNLAGSVTQAHLVGTVPQANGAVDDRYGSVDVYFRAGDVRSAVQGKIAVYIDFTGIRT